MTTTDSILEQIESLGYLTSVHCVGKYVEMYALLQQSDLTKLVFVRIDDEDYDEARYRCACVLAETLGLDPRAC